jgi:hypothetical protein
LLERTFELAEIPNRPCFLVLDVVQMVGEDNDPRYSQRVRDGELRTYLVLNGRRIDYLNRYVKSRNMAPERLSIPIAPGFLHRGRNTVSLQLTGMATKDKELDDFGLLQMAIEFRSTPSRVLEPLREPGPP